MARLNYYNINKCDNQNENVRFFISYKNEISHHEYIHFE